MSTDVGTVLVNRKPGMFPAPFSIKYKLHTYMFVPDYESIVT